MIVWWKQGAANIHGKQLREWRGQVFQSWHIIIGGSFNQAQTSFIVGNVLNSDGDILHYHDSSHARDTLRLFHHRLMTAIARLFGGG